MNVAVIRLMNSTSNYVARPTELVPFHTYLEPYFRLIEPVVRDFDWLCTELEIAGDLPANTVDNLGRIWLTGGELIDFVYGGPQFIWGVLTAVFPHDREAAMADKTVPFADSYADCWSPTRGPQHPYGYLEIVCFDSSATLLIGGDAFAVTAFKEAFPAAAPIQH